MLHQFLIASDFGTCIIKLAGSQLLTKDSCSSFRSDAFPSV